MLIEHFVPGFCYIGDCECQTSACINPNCTLIYSMCQFSDAAPTDIKYYKMTQGIPKFSLLWAQIVLEMFVQLPIYQKCWCCYSHFRYTWQRCSPTSNCKLVDQLQTEWFSSPLLSPFDMFIPNLARVTTDGAFPWLRRQMSSRVVIFYKPQFHH